MPVRATLRAQNPREAEALLEGLTLAGEQQIRMQRARGKPVPKLYESSVAYRREPPGSEAWRTWRDVMVSGYGDCEDLAAARVAELRARDGERGARVFVKVVRPGLWHILVRRADGTIEDPSRRLGMKGAG